MGNEVEHHRDGEIAVLTLNNPQRRNALSLAARQSLSGLLKDCAADVACRAIVLTGAGGHFCSGGDLKPVGGADAPPDAARTRHNIGILHDIVRLLAAGPKPTVAAVQGYAYGAGMSLAAACDYVLVTPSARFCASFGKVGLMADAGLMWSLPNRVGLSCARQLLLSARVVEGEESMRLGLSDQVVEEDGLLAEAVRAARKLSDLAPLSIAATKQVLARGPASLESVIAAESDLQPKLSMSLDYLEGRAAFNDRRAPRFRGV
jgi:enoyl-CoA hydratase/carnithine racemase